MMLDKFESATQEMAQFVFDFAGLKSGEKHIVYAENKEYPKPPSLSK